jgi:hypothetical protein
MQDGTWAFRGQQRTIVLVLVQVGWTQDRGVGRVSPKTAPGLTKHSCRKESHGCGEL